MAMATRSFPATSGWIDRPASSGDYDDLVQRSVDPVEYELTRRAAVRGERAMREGLRQRGWTVRVIPGHNWRSPGPDAVAWKRSGPGARPKVLILDNKNLGTARRVQVRDLGGLSGPSLRDHLWGLVGKMQATGRDPEVRRLLTQTALAAQTSIREARAAGITGSELAGVRVPLPVGVRLMVTNAGGRALGVDDAAKALGIGFGNLNRKRKVARGASRLPGAI
jgi:hypothetical protein